MPIKTFTYRVYPNSGKGWRGRPWQRGDGVGGLWRSRPFHRGDGFGSFLSRMTKKILPLAGKFANKSMKAIKNSDTLKEVGKTILDSGVEALADVAANSLDPTNNNSVAENAQLRLDQARKDIADILRSKRKGKSRKTTENLDDDDGSDSSSSLEDVPVVKRAKTVKKNAKRKKYNMLKKVKNGKA